VQVDGVGVRQDNWTDLGECKWGDVSSPAALAAELDEKVRRYPNARNATIGRRLFVKTAGARAKARLEGICVHTLQELYDLGEVSRSAGRNRPTTSPAARRSCRGWPRRTYLTALCRQATPLMTARLKVKLSREHSRQIWG
jgi:hypothetical protein